MICRTYDIVVVPFPFSERNAQKRRPALALSTEAFSRMSGHSLLAMITSVANPPWPFDTIIDGQSAGLTKSSKVRLKLFTLDNRLVLRRIGRLGSDDRKAVQAAMAKMLDLV